jgi:excisionase family DNA binding protein
MSTMALPAKGFLSVEEAAAILGVTGSRVRQMLREDELRGEKLGVRSWAVYRDSVEKAAKNQVDGGRGRPRSGAA